MDIHIFILCYNEEVLLPNTIKFYKNRFPNCIITIYDNLSTDESVSIAKKHNCNVISFNTNGENNVYIKRDLVNKCWNNIKKGWVIVADMDEWLDITIDDLINEYNNKTTILKIKGIDMIGESNNILLNDIDLDKINKYIDNDFESKNICFLREKIVSMNYTCGHHKCKPTGIIKYSNKIYYLKHMNYLGLEFLINKMTNRYIRSINMQKKNLSRHYHEDKEKIIQDYNNKLISSKLIDKLFNN